MSHNIIPAEHIGIVAAYLSSIALRDRFGKYGWIETTFVNKVPNWHELNSENKKNWETECFIEHVIIPSGMWIVPEKKRQENRKDFAGAGRVKFARNIASAIAHLNEVDHNYETRDGPFHETLQRVAEETRQRSQLRGFGYGRKGGQEFREAAAWFAEYYLDSKPKIQPIHLIKLIYEARSNIAMHNKGTNDYSVKFTEIYHDLVELCEKAIVAAVWHSRFFKHAPPVWEDKYLYDDFLEGRQLSQSQPCEAPD